MKIAIPCENKMVAAHFGHAPQFAIFDIEVDQGKITNQVFVDAPPHEPGLLPKWLAEQDVKVVLAGGMGGRAQDLFNQAGISVSVGVTEPDPKAAVEGFIEGSLTSGTNPCDH